MENDFLSWPKVITNVTNRAGARVYGKIDSRIECRQADSFGG